MSVTPSDVKFRKSVVVGDTTANGGQKGSVQVVSGVRHSLFPRVTKSERTTGKTRYRKEFWCNENTLNEIAYGLLIWLEYPSVADDRFYLLKGDADDTQLTKETPAAGAVNMWTGAGTLALALSGGETSVKLAMENNDFKFENGGYLHLADKVRTSQTVASDVNIGDSVTFGGATWTKISATDDIDYPNGIYLGDNKVMTLESTTHEEWATIAENQVVGEVIGTGDGASATPTLTDLSAIANGLSETLNKVLQVSTIDAADNPMVAYFNQDGTINTTLSDASAGEIGSDGVWTTDITWDSPPKSAANISATYWTKAYSYSGNTVTVELEYGVLNSYTVANTVGSGCISADEIKASLDAWVLTSAAGTYDDTTYPVVPENAGAEEDTITITFTSGIAFTAAGSRLGNLGSGTVSADFAPTSPLTGETMFTLLSAGWGGTFLAGDTVVFDLHASAQGFWLKEVVPPATDQEPYNLAVLGWYSE